MVQPLAKPKRVKKFGLKKFNRHQHDRKIAVKVCNCSLSVGGREFALLYSIAVQLEFLESATIYRERNTLRSLSNMHCRSVEACKL